MIFAMHYAYTLLWYIQHAPYMLMAAELGCESWYDAAEFANTHGIITPGLRRWIQPAEPEWEPPPPTGDQLDHWRMLHLMNGDPDAALAHLDEVTQLERMTFEDHRLAGGRLTRLQPSRSVRLAWFRDPQQVASRIGTSLAYGKRFVDAFTELDTDSRTAHQLCKQAAEGPAQAVDYLEIIASELHKLAPTDKLEFGWDYDLDVKLNQIGDDDMTTELETIFLGKNGEFFATVNDNVPLFESAGSTEEVHDPSDVLESYSEAFQENVKKLRAIQSYDRLKKAGQVIFNAKSTLTKREFNWLMTEYKLLKAARKPQITELGQRAIEEFRHLVTAQAENLKAVSKHLYEMKADLVAKGLNETEIDALWQILNRAKGKPATATTDTKTLAF